jgi:hypothetical protein
MNQNTKRIKQITKKSKNNHKIKQKDLFYTINKSIAKLDSINLIMVVILEEPLYKIIFFIVKHYQQNGICLQTFLTFIISNYKYTIN